MKCEICRTRMTSITTECTLNVSGGEKKIINIPAYVCEVCKKVILKDYVKEAVISFAKKSSDSVVDFKVMQQKQEEEDTTIIMDMLF